MARSEPDQVAHVLSYARHWRKLVAFLVHYRLHPELGARLHVLRHEDVLVQPRQEAGRLCEFLGVAFDPDMINPDAYVDHATNRRWTGNSSFEGRLQGLAPNRANHWDDHLDPPIRRLVDLVCGPEMRLAGYVPLETFRNQWPPSDILDYLLASEQDYASWRSDSGDVLTDYGSELFRLSMSDAPESSLNPDLIRRAFLFDAVYRAVRLKKPLDLVRPAGVPQAIDTRRRPAPTEAG
jgi:hypothetical protein